ncbi:MAG: peroxide stress protein YaaA [bacterium]
MKFIISPAKKMIVNTDDFPDHGLPVMIKETEIIKQRLQAMSYADLKKMWKCNDAIAKNSYANLAHMDLYHFLTPAVIAYQGIQYQYMAPHIFTHDEYDYINAHLYILSGFYGILSPFDGVVSYRLEMGASLSIGSAKNLYDFWSDKLYRQITKDDHVIVNLASKEYSRAITPYLTKEDHMITIVFGTLKDGKIIQKGTLAKMARGAMIRYAASKQIEDVNQLKDFHELSYTFAPQYSTTDTYVFLREE